MFFDSLEHQSTVERAKARPNSTAAIAIRAAYDEQYRREQARKDAVKGFFKKIVGR